MSNIVPGFTFLARKPPYNTKHLYIVISIIDNNTKALSVNVTSKKDRDESCILKVGDHEFVTHDSVIRYEDAITPKIDTLTEAIKKGVIERQEPVRNDVLNRILEDARNSKALAQKYSNELNYGKNCG